MIAGKLDSPRGERLQSLILGLDAINLYTQIAEAAEDEEIKKLFLDVAKEKKTHVGEFLSALKAIDSEQVEELKAGSEEAAELMGMNHLPTHPMIRTNGGG